MPYFHICTWWVFQYLFLFSRKFFFNSKTRFLRFPWRWGSWTNVQKFSLLTGECLRGCMCSYVDWNHRTRCTWPTAIPTDTQTSWRTSPESNGTLSGNRRKFIRTQSASRQGDWAGPYQLVDMGFVHLSEQCLVRIDRSLSEVVLLIPKLGSRMAGSPRQHLQCKAESR